MAEIINGTCHAKKAPQEGPPLFQHGNLVFQAHHVGWIVTGTFTIVSIITSFWLINKHLQWYTNKHEQRYIVRILFMVPIYAIVSFASYLFWNHSTPLLLLRDCYESTVLTSFFYLLLMYLSPNPEEQKAILRKNGLSRERDRQARTKSEKIQRWMFPLGPVKSKPADGLYFLQMMKWGVLQYCVVRPTTTLAAVILDYSGLYCEDSWSPRWGHVYITVFISVSVTVSMYCLLQLYMPVSKHLAVHKPILKMFSIKAVVFLTFWQATFLSFLTMFGVVKDTQFMTADNINIGLGAILETFEMMVFAFLHIRAFTYRPYKILPDRTPRWRSLGHAMNFAETARELWIGSVYIVNKFRGRETDMQARRDAVLEGVFGRSRYDIMQKQKPALGEKTQHSVTVSVDVDEMVHVGEERLWLGAGDDYAYGLGYQSRREKSESLSAQIERELDMRGIATGKHGYDAIGNLDLDPAPRSRGHHHPREQRSWWRSAFARISQPDNDPDHHHDVADDDLTPAIPRRTGRRTSWMHKSKQLSLSQEFEHLDFEDPSPSNVLSYCGSPRDHSAINEVSVIPTVLDHVAPPMFTAQPASPPPDNVSPQLPSSPLRQVKRKPPPRMVPSPPPNPAPLAVPLPSPSAGSRSKCADSLLGRMFPVSDSFHSAEAPNSTRHDYSSSQFHQHEVTGTVASQAPVVIHQGHPKVNSQERLAEIPQPMMSPAVSSSEPTLTPTLLAERVSWKRRSSHIRDSAQYQEAGPSRPKEPQSTHPDARRAARLTTGRILYPPLNPHAARRERVVLPSPLAPVVASSASPRRSHPQYPQTTSLIPMSPSAPPTSSHLVLRPPLGCRHSFASSSHQAVFTPHSSNPHSSPSQPHGYGPQKPASSSFSNSPQPSGKVSSTPQLRRAIQNVKRHSYETQEGQSRSASRPDRRLSAPSDLPQKAAYFSSIDRASPTLHTVYESGTGRSY